ncbi:hypothetical protein [Nocardioides hwasunensis]|uniref:SRPBCC family protein n=1 Tax=Nocardioides hwasunensis TaxID=397258 RepID=A0ABR8MEK2_9ACTN|nr:hypothetical protein [Nocardioides hwasunensis]MBD3914532.1 hypothetical protein [Nocardioides hwasunensis]
MDWARATVAGHAHELPGDDLVTADVVMDRGFDLAAPPHDVWPWLVQLGKRRAGWYLPRSVERFVPPSRRGRTDLTWCLHVLPTPDGGTRVHLRLRLGPVRRRRVATYAGGVVDALTISGLAAGMRERVGR